jgi:hypothetical protein
MLRLIARLRAGTRVPRFDGSTGARRRGLAARSWRTAAAGLALALVAGSGIAVASVSAASAHDAKYTPSCGGVTVEAWSYAGPGGQPNQRNSITFQVDSLPAETIQFDGGETHFFAFPNSTEAHTFSIQVRAWNDPNHTGWNKNWTGTSTPCTPPAILSLSAPQCNVTGDLTDLTATFEKLVAGRQYLLQLDSTAGGASAANYTPTQTTGSYTWTDMTPGRSYTLTIIDTTNTSLKASTSVTLVGCPDQSGISVTPTECSAPGGNGNLSVTANSLVTGREYRIDVYNASTNAIVGTHTFPASAATETYNHPATPSASYYATVIDTTEVGAVAVKSGTYSFLPCPKVPGGPTLTVTECNNIPATLAALAGGGAIQIVVSNLVPGRTYNITVTGGAATVVFSELGYLAPSDTYTKDLTGLPAGTYTAVVTDVMLPAFTNTSSASLLPCPTTDTTIDLAGTVCTVPGGKSDITATISNYAVGRAYTVTLTLNNVVVGAPQPLDSSTGAPQVIVFTGLTPGETYRVIVSDDLAVPAVTAAADFALAACPGDPEIALAMRECSVIGSSTIKVDLGKLVAGETYNVTIVTTSTSAPVPGVPTQQVTAALPTASLLFAKLPNGVDYTITVENVAQTLKATGTILLRICDLPTFDLPTLAFTGTSTLPPTLAGLGFLQLGLVLVGVGIVRRRSGAREA